jgi:hypothetical protein
MHEAGANGVDNSRTIGSRQNALLALASHTANVDAYRARSKGVQWSSQLLAECSGWLKCDKAKLKSTAGKELTSWFSARGMARASFVNNQRAAANDRCRSQSGCVVELGGAAAVFHSREQKT